MSLEVGGRGACEGGGWLQNHKECKRMLWPGGGRLDSESKQLHETVIIFMSLGVGVRGEWPQNGTVGIFMILEVGGKLAAGLRIRRNAWAVIIFKVFEVLRTHGIILHRTVIIFIVCSRP